MSIEVHVRIRSDVPPDAVWAAADTVLYNTLQPSTRYVYNKVHAAHATNRSIFQGVEPLLHAAFEGKHVTVLAYGQTGSGKTHSMLGSADDAGVIPRAARLLLQLVHSHPGSALGVSFTEIYNEAVKDLLDPQRGGGDLALHDAPDGTVRYDKKVAWLEGIDHFFQLQQQAERQRQYGVTDLNAHSSRSHMMLTFEIRRAMVAGGGGADGGPTPVISSVVHLVDLAGSECAARANTEGQSLREGGFINKSLLALGNVVDAIVERRSHIPYRDAKLTRLLRSCFGGGGLTFILCCVHPGRENVEQTTSSLRFTQRAMRMRGDPVMTLNIPPLFAHQYANAAQVLCRSAKQAAVEAYERGIRDSYLYCDGTLSEIVTTTHNQMAESLHALAGMQRLLIAHDHALAIEELGRGYEKLHLAEKQRDESGWQLQQDEEALKEVEEAVQRREAELLDLKREVRAAREELDVEMGKWEHQLAQAKQGEVSPLSLLMDEESCERFRILFEWAVCVEKIASTSVPRLVACCLREGGGGGLVLEGEAVTPQQSEGGGAASSSSALSAVPQMISRDALQEQLARERRELLDLEAAQELLLHDDVAAVAGGGGQTRRRRQGDKAEAAIDEEEVEGSSQKPQSGEAEAGGSYPTLQELDQQIDNLEREERVLHRQLRYNTHRYSLRRIRSSLTPPLGGGGEEEGDDDDEEENNNNNSEEEAGMRRRRRRRRRLDLASRITIPVASSASTVVGGVSPSHHHLSSVPPPSPPPPSKDHRGTTVANSSNSPGGGMIVSPQRATAQRTSSPSPLPLTHPLRKKMESEALLLSSSINGGGNGSPTPASRRGQRQRSPGSFLTASDIQDTIRRIDGVRLLLQSQSVVSSGEEEEEAHTRNNKSTTPPLPSPLSRVRTTSNSNNNNNKNNNEEEEEGEEESEQNKGKTLYERYGSRRYHTAATRLPSPTIQKENCIPVEHLHYHHSNFAVVGGGQAVKKPRLPPSPPPLQAQEEEEHQSATHSSSSRRSRGGRPGLSPSSTSSSFASSFAAVGGTMARALWSRKSNTEE